MLVGNTKDVDASAAAQLAAATGQLDEADISARAAVTSALRALPELERLLQDMGTADRDGCGTLQWFGAEVLPHSEGTTTSITSKLAKGDLSNLTG